MDKETAKALNDLARHQMKRKLLADILEDINICMIEGWDYKEYIEQLKDEIDQIAKRFESV